MVSFTGALVAVVLLLAGCEQRQPAIQLAGATMGTQYSVKVVNAGAVEANVLKAEIDALLTAVNATMSTYDPASELSRLNRNPSTAWIGISQELSDVLQGAVAIGQASGGAFDVTVGPLVNLWGFGPGRGTSAVPDAAAIERERQRIGLDKLVLRASPAAVRKRRGDVMIDLSGIAKGYAVDRIAEHLDARGVTDYLIDIGGELRAGGVNQTGAPWRIGIENPMIGGPAIVQTVPLSGNGMASSGNYRNFFEIDGVRYGHTIDPRTGSPTQHRLAAVTVVHRSTMIADAWATALMSLGFAAGVKIAEAHGLAVLFIVGAADTWESHATRAFEPIVGQSGSPARGE